MAMKKASKKTTTAPSGRFVKKNGRNQGSAASKVLKSKSATSGRFIATLEQTGASPDVIDAAKRVAAAS